MMPNSSRALRVATALALLLLLPCAMCGEAEFSAAEVAAAQPWGPAIATHAAARASARRLHKATPALRKHIFKLWTQDFSKTYSDASREAAAHAVWQQHLETVIATNSDPASTWVASMNEFADMSWEEFSKRLGAQPPKARKPSAKRAAPSRRLLQTGPPATVDWVAAGKVTAVRNQSKCAACWVFSAVAAMESMARIKNGTSYDLSEQSIIDCAGASNGYASTGCSGGSVADAFTYGFQYNVTMDSAYPFTQLTGTCNTTKLAATTAKQVLRVQTDPGYTLIAANSKDAMRAAVASRPLVTYFNANSKFQLYKSGVFPAANCTDTGVNHAMLLVGYNTTGYSTNASINTAYWRFKNSWGTAWGEVGYGRVQMLPDSNGACAMYNWGFSPSTVM